MDTQEFTIRILIALICGLAIGVEREIHHKNAGIRTNGLVSLGAAIYVLLSYRIIQNHTGDITRIVGQVVTGVGFLCAGVIFRHGISVQGLTTAATVWCSAGIGCLAAAGFYAEAIICAVTVIGVNGLLRIVDNWIEKPPQKEQKEE